MSVLAIDLGTTNVKAAVVGPEGALLGRGRRPVHTKLTADGGATQDAELVWRATLDACREALAAAPAATVQAVACCSQYSSIVPVDDAAAPCGPMITWMDQRGSSERLGALAGHRVTPRLVRKLRWVRLHGIPPLESGADSLSHMRWLRHARPEVYAATSTFLEPMDYLSARLSGRRASNRCASFLMLVTDCRPGAPLRYHPRLLAWSGIDAAKLPELVELDQPLGTLLPEVADALGLGRETVVMPGINDSQAGGLGAAALGSTQLGVSIGTTSVCTGHVDFKRTDIFNSILSAPSPVPDKFFLMAEGGIGGKAVEHLLEGLVYASDNFGPGSDGDRYAALQRAVEQVPPGSEGLLFLPWLQGSQAPVEDGKMRGGFLNLSLATTREHLARAVLEGVAYNLRWLLETVEGFTRRRAERIAFYGGGAASTAWAQILADVLGVEILQLEQPSYAACRGVGLLAHYHLGAASLDSFAAALPVRARLEPRPELAAVYAPLFDQFLHAFRRNRRIFHALNTGQP